MNEPGRRWWIALSIGVGACVLLVLGVSIAATSPLMHGIVSESEATIWVTAFAAIGTLGAVWAALYAVHLTTRETRRMQRDAHAREEALRHDAIRPIIALEYGWLERQVQIKVTNVGIYPALAFTCIVEAPDPSINITVTITTIGEEHARPLPPAGIVLMPHEPTNHRPEVQYEFGGQVKTAYRSLNPSVTIFSFKHNTDATVGTWKAICRYEDVLHARWRQVADVAFEAHLAYKGHGFTGIAIGPPRPD